MPQLGYYLEQCNEHIEFTVKVSTMSFGGMFGGIGDGGDAPTGVEIETQEGKFIDGYKVANEDDMDFLANLLGSS